MLIKAGPIEDFVLQDNHVYINTENCGFPVVIAFREDELHNVLMKLLSNPDMTKIAVFPPGWGRDGKPGKEGDEPQKKAKKEFMDSIPVPETPEATKSAIKFLRKAAINKLLNKPEAFDVSADENKVMEIELGSGLDRHE